MSSPFSRLRTGLAWLLSDRSPPEVVVHSQILVTFQFDLTLAALQKQDSVNVCVQSLRGHLAPRSADQLPLTCYSQGHIRASIVDL